MPVVTETVVQPQPLTGLEIRTGIAARIAREVPPEHAEEVRRIIFEGLGKTCSLESSASYSKFSADWQVIPESGAWWIDYHLDDFGRVTKNGIGTFGRLVAPGAITGHIPEMPPDRFRRETEQPIPKPAELKKLDAQQVTFSKAAKRGRPRKNV